MFSFDSIDISRCGFLNLDSRKLITTQDVGATFSRPGCRVIIFFLYGRSDETDDFPDAFGNAFGDINYQTNQDIDFWTHSNSFNLDNLTDYQMDAWVKQSEISELAATRRRDNNNRKGKNNGYQNMRLLAQLFNVDITCSPCFILFDPISHTILNLGFNKNLSPITQVRIIIEIIKDKQFDWDEISTFYHTPYSRLSYDGGEELQEILKKHYRLDKFGFSINELRGYGLTCSYALEHKLHGGYVSLKRFLYNYKDFCNENKDSIERIEDIYCEYIKYLRFKTKQDVPYPEIHQYLEDESYSNLYYAQNIVNDGEYEETCSKYSLACFCIGKVLETEINLGYVQEIRRELGIPMPKNYNQWAYSYNAMVSVLSRDKFGNKHDECIDYNQRLSGNNSNALRHPDISKTRKLLFEVQDISEDENGKKLRDFRDRLQKKVFNGTLREVRSALNTIFKNRNNAVHGQCHIKRETYNQSIEAFETLINNGFFINNADIKNRLKNQ